MVFIEGQFIFKDPRIRDMLDMKIYVEVDDDIRLSRLGTSLFNYLNKFLNFNLLELNFLAILENYYINNNVNAFKSFFIIYEKYMKPSFEQNVDLVNKPFYFI